MTLSAYPLYTTSRNLDLAHRKCCHTYMRMHVSVHYPHTPFLLPIHPYIHKSVQPNNQTAPRHKHIHNLYITLRFVTHTCHLLFVRFAACTEPLRMAVCKVRSEFRSHLDVCRCAWRCHVQVRCSLGEEDRLFEQCNDQGWKSVSGLGSASDFGVDKHIHPTTPLRKEKSKIPT